MNKPALSHVAFASFIGTAIEFYDFYIYAMAAAMVIGKVFFPLQDTTAQSLNALLTFGLAFVARPMGALVFGHFGDKVGRKATLSISLLLMGASTFFIGLLPGYHMLGFWAPLLLCLLRFGQGVGLGGEWAGAALLATEYAPDHERGWYGMFPQLGPAIGFLLATLTFLTLTLNLSEQEFERWGWRIPFLISALLVVIGFYVRFRLAETPAFRLMSSTQRAHRWPLFVVIKRHGRAILLCALAMGVCYHLFYTASVFCLNYGTQELHIAKSDFLLMLCVAVTGMLVATPLSARWSDQVNRTTVLILGTLSTIGLSFLLAPMMESGVYWIMTLFLWMTLFLMGVIFAPMGAWLPEQFPVAVRYTGAGLSYQLGGILGASFAPAVSSWLNRQGGLKWVGIYMACMAAVSFLAIYAVRKTSCTQQV